MRDDTAGCAAQACATRYSSPSGSGDMHGSDRSSSGQRCAGGGVRGSLGKPPPAVGSGSTGSGDPKGTLARQPALTQRAAPMPPPPPPPPPPGRQLPAALHLNLPPAPFPAAAGLCDFYGTQTLEGQAALRRRGWDWWGRPACRLAAACMAGGSTRPPVSHPARLLFSQTVSAGRSPGHSATRAATPAAGAAAPASPATAGRR